MAVWGKTYSVELPYYNPRKARAASSVVQAAQVGLHESGALVFQDADGQLILAFNPNHWVKVEKVEEEE